MGNSLLLLGVSCSIVISLATFWFLKSPDLSHIETVGPPGFLGSYWTAIQFAIDGSKYLKEGYDRCKPRPFKVPTLRGWWVILNQEHLEDIANISEDDLSFSEAVNESLQVEYTCGSEMHHDPYHHMIIRSQLSRNLPSLCPDIKDEMTEAFNELLDVTGNEWKTIPANETIRRIISRTSNRVFVGLPLCRDPGWNDFTINLTAAIAKEAIILRLFPRFIVPLVARCLTGLTERTRKGSIYLGPMIEERQQHMNKYAGNKWPEKPNDFLQWCLDAGRESSVTLLARRIMSINFAAIHTSSNTFTQALYHLAANPRHAQLLREEVQTVVEKYGWTKEALGKMRRVDSFLKETLRYEGIALLTVARKALNDVKLSDGTIIPSGTSIRIATNGIHRDSGVYSNADEFEPLRFADLGDDRDKHRYHMVNVNSVSLPFGYGRSACPGRFFVAVVLKMMLAHMVLLYDVKVDANGPQPKNFVLGHSIVADPKANLMFRKRSDS